MQPRPYQVKALNRILNEFNSGIQRTLLVMATGLGKTVILTGMAFCKAYNKDRTPTGKKVLVLAHQNILIDQAAEKFEQAVGVQVSREKGSETCLDSPYPITVSSVQTMSRRLEKFDPNYFDLIIIDEAHHSESKQYKKVLNYFNTALVLGVTATPDRADKKNLGLFESVAFQYSIQEAQKDGYLAPITLQKAGIEIDLSKVKKRKGDLIDSDLGTVIEDHLIDIAKQVRPMTQGRKIVCFVPLIKTARKAAETFSKYGFNAVAISGEESKADRAEILNGFESGRYDIIFNAMILTEGYDCPQVDCVIVLRPTTSRALYVQMVGRGLRLAEGKKDCLLIDFLFQHEGFDLAGPKDILGRRSEKKSGQKGKGQFHGQPVQAETPEERLV
ncbi:MAG: DEAD/DEAH box helicase, partial [Allobaculum sp.]|nr:DEAD/DEAH box helicase [Allobaculum sp.]